MTPAECAAWDAANPRVWTLFVKYAWTRWHAQERQGIAPERRRFSARAIIGKIRWDVAIATERGADWAGWKINDHMSTYFAKRFLERYPALEGYFQLRRVPEPRGHWGQPPQPATTLF